MAATEGVVLRDVHSRRDTVSREGKAERRALPGTSAQARLVEFSGASSRAGVRRVRLLLSCDMSLNFLGTCE